MKKFRTLQEYLEATGTTSRELIVAIFQATGVRISESLFSYYLRGSRRISGWNAHAISIVTGVPIDNLTVWPKSSRSEKSSGGRQKHNGRKSKETANVA